MVKNTSGSGRWKDVALVVIGWVALLGYSALLGHPLEALSLGMIARAEPSHSLRALVDTERPASAWPKSGSSRRRRAAGTSAAWRIASHSVAPTCRARHDATQKGRNCSRPFASCSPGAVGRP